MRILVFTGKGGVGKTGIAAATAVKTASLGYRTMVMSTDQAHSLADAFERRIGALPVRIADNTGALSAPVADNTGAEATKANGFLDALEVDPAVESERTWGSLKGYLRQIIEEKSGSGLASEEALIFPGLEELSSLLRILDFTDSGLYDVIIVDCAPTGETLSLLRYPEQLRVLTDKVLPMVRSFNSALGGLISRATTVPKPRDAVFAELDALSGRLAELQRILCDRQKTSLRIVMTPESIVVDEAQRCYAWLNAFDFGVDAVYVNRIYPQEAMKGYFAGWEKIQEKSLRRIEESFTDQEIFRLLLQDRELRGMDVLTDAGRQLYSGPGREDPTAVFCTEQSYRIERNLEDGSWVMTVKLPYMTADDLSVSKEESDLILGVRNETRRFRLIDQCSRRRLTGWKYGDGQLVITFA